MKKALLIILFLTGCHSKQLNNLMGIPEKVQAEQFLPVACCQDLDSSKNMTWPSFVPQSHRDFCEQVRVANMNDQEINGNTYLMVKVDCGHHNYIGDEYYAGKGY